MTRSHLKINLNEIKDLAPDFGIGEPVAAKDVVYCAPAAMREWEARPDGLELLAFGGHAEMQPGWWTD
ncbi:MAG: hypothetical protein ACR2OB_12810 [Solirubrobacteraceae bacterium]